MGTLRISRDSGYADRARKYKIICNGECLGKIGNGETQEYEVSPGGKEVYLKIDWCRSNKVRVEVPENGLVSVKGGSNLRGLKLLLAIFYVLLAPHNYLWLSSNSD
ncbi:hypothetical protein [Alkalilimnicola ehrlichii]|uniref:Uncharacterized protein n=1 Tax=Alkalilimnicola ehrlichii TaxID=351052 RepID=A0A3E0WWQ3_9GAMM|nr:hypothetical protein [Alkalilimnicola ehrlichii]RFA37402.1 hypothetical protein CAL65_08915 [Alkalilimnicola ehrlichii]